MRLGDVLVATGDRDLRSVSALYAALEDATDGRLPIRLQRGAGAVEATLDLGDAAARDGRSASSDGRVPPGEHRV